MSDQLLAGKSILILEDEFLIAMDVEQLCSDHGAARTRIIRTLDEAARTSHAEGEIDIAILDVMLAGQSTFDFAHLLAANGVPFVFATGYSDPEKLLKLFPGVETVNKPYSGKDLIHALLRTLQRRSG